MAKKKRTRRNKKQVKHHYSLPSLDETPKAESRNTTSKVVGSRSKREISNVAVSGGEMFGYDPGLIARDIRKTLLVGMMILGIQIGFYFYWM